MGYSISDNSTNPATTGTMPQDVHAGHEGIVGHISNNTDNLRGDVNTPIALEVVPDLLHCPFDDSVVKMGWATTPINAITRAVGYKVTKSMFYDFFSVDMRQCLDKVTTAFSADSSTTPTAEKLAAKKLPSTATIVVANPSAFDVTDQIMFKGVCTKDDNGNDIPYNYLNARVSAVSTSNITIQFLNASKTGISIPANTIIVNLGHALAEEDASVAPYAALPEPSEQYMQKFMVNAVISNVYLESEKNVNWGLSDIKEMCAQEFVESIEKSYIFGKKSYTQDPTTKLFTRTTAGIIQQMIEGGSPVIKLYKDTISDEKLIQTMSEIFVGNSGSTKRYWLTGMELATSLFSLKGIQRQLNANDTTREFEYDWAKIRLFNFTLLNAPHPLLDKLGFSNWGLVLDKMYLERRVFRTLDEDVEDLMKLRLYDGKAIRCCEISSLVLKYPACHALVILEDNDPSES